jgi:N-acetylglutamate synthase-like GNAT family acetyltransferase
MKEASQNGLEIRPTKDYEAIRRLALASGLEDGTFQRTVAAFGYYLFDDLVGCASLNRDGERYIVDWLAVAERMRGKGLGDGLVGMIAKEAKRRGANRLWALARAPEFFEKIGFRRSVVDDGIGPVLDNCLVCRQYQKSCFPAVMIRDL